MVEWLFKKIRCMMVGKCHARIPSIQQMFNFITRCILFFPVAVGFLAIGILMLVVMMLYCGFFGLVGVFSFSLAIQMFKWGENFMDNLDWYMEKIGKKLGIKGGWIDSYVEWVIAKFPIKTA